jgi:hypothetical protein
LFLAEESTEVADQRERDGPVGPKAGEYDVIASRVDDREVG